MECVDEQRTRELQAKGQAALIEFLTAELDLAFTFLETAEVDRGEPEMVEKVLGNVRNALQTLRHFEGRIEDLDTRRVIHGRANDLEVALQSFPTAR